MTQTLQVACMNVSKESYPIHIGERLLSTIGHELSLINKEPTSIYIITDDNVDEYFSETIEKSIGQYNFPIEKCVVPAGESAKNMTVAMRCWEKMAQAGVDRQSIVIGLGGGSITDLAAFVASCFMRGIPIIQVPTTLLGMVDASIGGKTAVNFYNLKNIIGTFQQPRSVIIDIDTLKSLPEREFRSGIAEIIKAAFIKDPELFKFLETEMKQILSKREETLKYIIERAVAIKAEIVEQDEKDMGIRSILNWGHTFAHAIESCTEFSQYTHGEAVAIGMSAAATLSLLTAGLSEETLKRQDDLLLKAGLPIHLPEISDALIVERMRGDKKNQNGHIACIVAKELGDVEKRSHLQEEVILQALQIKRSRDALNK